MRGGSTTGDKVLGTVQGATGDDGESGTNNVNTNWVTGTAIGIGDHISSGWRHIFGGKRRRTRKNRKGRKGRRTRKGRKVRRRRR